MLIARDALNVAELLPKRTDGTDILSLKTFKLSWLRSGTHWAELKVFRREKMVLTTSTMKSKTEIKPFVYETTSLLRIFYMPRAAVVLWTVHAKDFVYALIIGISA